MLPYFRQNVGEPFGAYLAFGELLAIGVLNLKHGPIGVWHQRIARAMKKHKDPSALYSSCSTLMSHSDRSVGDDPLQVEQA